MHILPFSPAHIELITGHPPAAPYDPEINRAWTLFDGERPVAAGGFHLMRDRQAYLWSMLSDEIKARPFTLHRLVKRQLPSFIANNGIDVLYSDANILFLPGMKWLNRLGFSPVHILTDPYGDGQDYMLYERDERLRSPDPDGGAGLRDRQRGARPDPGRGGNLGGV
jgi:hypothetical protein